MKKNGALSERYNEAMARVHASDELLRKVEAMNNENHRRRKIIILRRALCVAAAVVVLFIMSNAVALAATGETWVARFIWDEDPGQPMDNVQNFFNANVDVFGEKYGGNAAENYYGGTYLDGGIQVILLTDLSKSDEFTEVPENVMFEKCDYTYAELADGIKEINGALSQQRNQGEAYAYDVISWGLNNKENRLCVDIYRMNDEKVRWFKENVSDEPYLVLSNTDWKPENDAEFLD